MTKMILTFMILFGILYTCGIVFKNLQSFEKNLVIKVLLESLIYGIVAAVILIGVVSLF